MPKKKSLALVASARIPLNRNGGPRVTRIKTRAHDLPKAIIDAIATFEKSIGGRQALLEALSTADADETVSTVLQAIGDPAFDRIALSVLCAEAGITPGQLFQAFDKAALVRAQILGRLEAANAIPATVKEVARTAVPYEQLCESCNGLGHHKEGDEDNLKRTVCTKCNGRGHLLRDGNPDQQHTLFELTGLLKSSGGVQVLQQTTVMTPGHALDQLQQVMGDLIYTRPTIDVDP